MNLRPKRLWFVALFFAVSAQAQEARVWPCPEFGECRAKLTLGVCKGFLNFEYSKRYHTTENKPFWEPDDPKPCLLTFRVGKKLQRHTFARYKCEEIAALFEKLAPTEQTPLLSKSDSYRCDPAEHPGTLLLVHPEQSFKEGHWQSLTRTRHVIKGFEDCTIQYGAKAIVCPNLQGQEREWLMDMMGILRWRVRGRKLVTPPKPEEPKLAPGDRMRGL